MANITNERICSICKEVIHLDNINEKFFFDIVGKNKVKKCSHCDCYINYHTSKKKNPMTVDECKKYINECAELTKQELIEYENKVAEKLRIKAEKDKEKELKRIEREKKAIEKQKIAEENQKKKIIKDEFFIFLQEMYEVTSLPQYMYIKFSDVFSGKYRDMNKPVPIEDLFDMWKQKKNYLNKTAERNRKMGKEIDGVSRISYDLAILLSKYDKYLAWKEKKELEKIKESESKDSGIDYNNLVGALPQKKTNKNTSKKVDITSMLDEI